ncbi:MAG: NADH-quinone oxidoreductase subunit A, partial [Gammaproteobacteria bacterium]|nr:NADH-quinone oxidoreductase subunit A [Gammaproteobacteria bacterium]
MGSEADIASAAVQGQNLWPVVVYALGVGVVVAASIGGSWLLGARTRKRKATDMPFESGIVPVGAAEQKRLSLEFYPIALLSALCAFETISLFG